DRERVFRLAVPDAHDMASMLANIANDRLVRLAFGGGPFEIVKHRHLSMRTEPAVHTILLEIEPGAIGLPIHLRHSGLDAAHRPGMTACVETRAMQKLPAGQITKSLSSPRTKNIPLPSSGKSAL